MTKSGAVKLPEALGWGFFIVLFLIAVGPAIWGFSLLSYESDSPVAAIGLGIGAAGFGAGLVTWAANAALQAYHERRAKAAKAAKAKSKGNKA